MKICTVQSREPRVRKVRLTLYQSSQSDHKEVSVVCINLSRAKQVNETERKRELMVEKNKAVRNKWL